MIQEQIFCSDNRILFRGFKLHKGSRKNQEAIKSTQLQQCSTHMPVIWVKAIVGTDIIKIPQGFNFFVKTDLMIS